jgi:hypothetical protein
MPLCIPRVQAPLTEWSQEVVVEGALQGATVIVRVNDPTGRVVVKSIVGGGRDRLSLLPGEELRAGETIFVQQTLGTEASPWTDPNLAVPVGTAPVDHSKLAPPRFISRLFDFSGRVWIGGIVPGAEVTVEQAGGGVLGKGISREEGARLILTTVMRAGQTLKAFQMAPPGRNPLIGSPKVANGTVQALPVSLGQPLPKPRLSGKDPEGCDGAIPIGDILDGSEVSVNRVTEGGIEKAIFDAENLWFILSKPLDSQGGYLEVTQKVADVGEWQPSPPLDIKFPPAKTPGIPNVPPLCAGTPAIYVSGLASGALVTLTITTDGGTILGQSVDYKGLIPPTETDFVFEVPPVLLNAQVSVVQERCSLISAITTVTVTEVEAVSAAELAEPLYECAGVVHAVKVHPGSRLRVWRRDSDGSVHMIKEVIRADQDSKQIEVDDLQIGQTFWIEQFSCGGPWLRSSDYEVKNAPPLQIPKIVVPPIEGDRSVTVDAIPGAWVEVFSQESDGYQLRIGKGFVDPVESKVPLQRSLKSGEAIYVRQSFCGEVSKYGEASPVSIGQRIFKLDLEKPKKWPVVTKDVVWDSGILTVNHDGSWTFTVSAENKDTKGDVDIDFHVSLAFAVPRKFGTVIALPLGSPGNDVGAQYGRINQGWAPANSRSRSGFFAEFLDATYWLEVLKTSARFEWFVAVKNYSSKPKDSKENKPTKGTP